MKERVIVLRTFKTGETNLIVHAINSRGGRMHFIARGGVVSRKRFGGGVLEPTHYLGVTYKPASGRNEETPLHELLEAQILREFSGLRQKYERIEAALQMLHVVGRVVQPGVEDASELFDLLGHALQAVEVSDSLPLLRLQFEIKLLHCLGTLPLQTWTHEFLGKSLKDHKDLVISGDQLRRGHSEVNTLLTRYLKGLSPTDMDLGTIMPV